MASVQTAPAMPQGGMSIPANLTQQNIQELYQVRYPRRHKLPPRISCIIIIADFMQKYLRMKEQGVREDDPEYLKAHNLLIALSQQSQMRKIKQQEAVRQQQQRQAQLQQQHNANSQIVANGANGKADQRY